MLQRVGGTAEDSRSRRSRIARRQYPCEGHDEGFGLLLACCCRRLPHPPPPPSSSSPVCERECHRGGMSVTSAGTAQRLLFHRRRSLLRCRNALQLSQAVVTASVRRRKRETSQSLCSSSLPACSRSGSGLNCPPRPSHPARKKSGVNSLKARRPRSALPPPFSCCDGGMRTPTRPSRQATAQVRRCPRRPCSFAPSCGQQSVETERRSREVRSIEEALHCVVKAQCAQRGLCRHHVGAIRS